MTPENERYVYTVHLRVEVSGPKAEWDEVAHLLAESVVGLREMRGRLTIDRVDIDQAEEVDAR